MNYGNILDEIQVRGLFREMAVPVDYDSWRLGHSDDEFDGLGMYQAFPEWDRVILTHKRGDYESLGLYLKMCNKTMSDDEIAEMSSGDIVSLVTLSHLISSVLGIERQLEDWIWFNIGKSDMKVYNSADYLYELWDEPSMIFARPEYILLTGREDMTPAYGIPEEHLGGDLFRSRIYRLPADLRVIYPDMQTVAAEGLPGYMTCKDGDDKCSFDAWTTDDGIYAWQMEQAHWSYKMTCLAGLELEFDVERAGVAEVEYDLSTLRTVDNDK